MLSIEVSELLKDKEAHLDLTLVAGKKGIKKKINIPRIQKPGLALIGDTSKLHPGIIQILGKSEIIYLNSLTSKKINQIIKKICDTNVACFIVTRGNKAPAPLTAQANKYGICV